MRNRKNFMLLAAMGLPVCTLIFCGGESGKKIVSNFTETAIEIDGDLAEWEGGGGGAKSIELADTSGAADPNKAEIMTLWDEENLYVAFRVTDADLRSSEKERDSKTLYQDDMAELIIDANHDRTEKWIADDIIWHINLFNQVKDDRGTPEGESDWTWNSVACWETKLSGSLNDSSDRDEGYVVEIAVPWTEIGRAPEAGVILGVDFALGDEDEGGPVNLYDWCGCSPFRYPAGFGELILAK
ncbi:sugar-binding protein [candidate division KSB1 bacterium]